MISSDTKKQVWYLHSVKKMSKSKIALKLDLSRNSVIKILSDKSTVNAQFIKDAQKVEQQSNESLLKMLKDDNRLPSIASKILDLMNDDSLLEAEIKKNGLRPLATVLGIISDKTIKAAELDKSINKPDNPVTVEIINNAPEPPKAIIRKEEQDGININ